MVLMSFASACCHPLSVKRLMWAAMSDVTAMPFKGHPLACSGVISSTHTEGLQEGQYRTPISGQNDPTGEEQDSSTYLKIADHLLAKGIIGLYLHPGTDSSLKPPPYGFSEDETTQVILPSYGRLAGYHAIIPRNWPQRCAAGLAW